jgi:EmrB/QacA subfamily drug resistance transporter
MQKKYLLNIVVSLAIFMEMLDSTILNTAIPSMSNSLQVSPINLKIALISYLLMIAIFVPISGWMADKWGAKKIFIGAVSIFTVSSFFCGLSHNLAELIFMRSIQGIGGAFMVPVARLLLIRSVNREEIVKVIGRVMIIGSLGLMLGPVVGGLITEYFSWPWIFFINIPVGFLTIILIGYTLQETDLIDVAKFDTLGFLLFGFGLAFLIFAFSASSEDDLRMSYVILSMALAALLLFLYYLHAKRIQHPVVNTQLFKFRSFQIAVLSGLFVRLGLGGLPFLLPLLFQIGFHYSPAQSGLLLMPMALGTLSSKSFVAFLLKKVGYRRYLLLNTFMSGCWIISLALLTSHTSVLIIIIQNFILGVLFSQQFSGMNSLAYQEVSQKQLSSATSFMSTLQQFSQSLGVAVAALLIHLGLFATNTNLITPEIFKWVFVILGLVTLVSGVIFFRLPAGAFTQNKSAVKS